MQLQQYGQSVWLDQISRSFLTTGELKRLIDEDGLRGMTSNPTIFQKAIGKGDDYADEDQATCARGRHRSPMCMKLW